MLDDGWLVHGSTSPDDVRRYYDDQAATDDTTLASWGYEAPARGNLLWRRHATK